MCSLQSKLQIRLQEISLGSQLSERLKKYERQKWFRDQGQQAKVYFSGRFSTYIRVLRSLQVFDGVLSVSETLSFTSRFPNCLYP